MLHIFVNEDNSVHRPTAYLDYLFLLESSMISKSQQKSDVFELYFLVLEAV